MSSTLFINFLKSFVGRFGIRTKVVSDNFRSFKSGETRNYFEFSIPWNSILEKSPWWGVFYEQLISIPVFRKTVGSAKFGFYELNSYRTDRKHAQKNTINVSIEWKRWRTYHTIASYVRKKYQSMYRCCRHPADINQYSLKLVLNT